MTFNQLRNLPEMFALTSWDIPVVIKDGDKTYNTKTHLSEENGWQLELQKVEKE